MLDSGCSGVSHGGSLQTQKTGPGTTEAWETWFKVPQRSPCNRGVPKFYLLHQGFLRVVDHIAAEDCEEVAKELKDGKKAFVFIQEGGKSYNF